MRKQKLIHGEEDGAAMLRKEEMRDYDRVREWKGKEEEGRERKGRGGKMRRDYIRQESIWLLKFSWFLALVSMNPFCTLQNFSIFTAIFTCLLDLFP